MTANSLQDVFAGITEYFSPRTVARVGEANINCSKVKGTYHWHRHDSADEFFLISKGTLTIHYQDREVTLGPDEFHVVPKGAVHKTSSKEGAEVLFVGPDDWIKV